MIKGTDSWGSSTGIHVPGPDGWILIEFSKAYDVHSVEVKQCHAPYISQNFKIEARAPGSSSFEEVKKYTGGVSQRQKYELDAPVAADAMRLKITGATAQDNWWRLTGIVIMGEESVAKECVETQCICKYTPMLL